MSLRGRVWLGITVGTVAFWGIVTACVASVIR